MSAYWKDIFREIKNTKGRFFSLLIIAALGAAGVVGIQAAAVDMRAVADKTYKERNLYDIQIKSTVGFGEDDISALSRADGVNRVMPAYLFDAYAYIENAAYSARAYSLPDTLNLIALTEGRLPQNDKECAVERRVLSAAGYNIGDTLTLGLDNPGDYALSQNEFTIVGVVSSPLYINLHERGQTALGNGRLDFYLYLHPSAYTFDVYTDVYIQMTDSPDMDNLSDEYNAAAEEWRDNIKLIGDTRVAAAESEIEDARKEIDDGFTEFNNNLIELEEKTADAWHNLVISKDALDEAKRELDENAAALDEIKDFLPPEEYTVMRREIDAGYAEYSKNAEIYETRLIEIISERSKAENELYEVRNKLTEARNELESVPAPEWFYFTRKDGADFDSYYQDTLRLERIGYIFPLVFFLVAVLVSLTTMTRMVEARRTQIGTYKALGFGGARIMAKYLIYAVSAGTIGGVLGVAAGSYIFPVVISDAYGHLYDMPPVDTPIPLFIGTIAAASAVLSVAAVTVITYAQTSGDAPAALMRPKPPRAGRRVALERFPFIWNRIGFIGKVTARNIFRYKRRFFMTLIGVAGCSALLVTAFGLRDSVGGVAAMQFGRIVKYDARAYLKDITEDGQRAELDEIMRGAGYLLIREESVKASSPGGELEVSLIVPENAAELTGFINLPSADTGEPLNLAGNGVIITEKLADKTGTAPGGEITVIYDGSVYAAPVAGVTENYLLNYIYISKEEYAGIFNKDAVSNGAFIISENLDDMAARLLANENARGFLKTSDQADSVSDSTDALGIVTIVLIALACMLALVVLYNLTNINITERIRELATLKVLGFYDRETAWYIYRENIAVTLMGILLGLWAGMFLHGFILITVEVDILMFPRIIYFSSYILSAALSAFFAVFVNLIMNGRLKRVDMVESLKDIE